MTPGAGPAAFQFQSITACPLRPFNLPNSTFSYLPSPLYYQIWPPLFILRPFCCATMAARGKHSTHSFRFTSSRRFPLIALLLFIQVMYIYHAISPVLKSTCMPIMVNLAIEFRECPHKNVLLTAL